MRLSTAAINRRTTVVIMLILVITLGLIAYQRLPREAAPDIQIPNIMVMSNYEGASPSDIESLVTRPIERKLKSLADIKEMRSTSSEGNSMIMIEFQPDTDIDFALQKVRDKVDEAKGDLPGDLEEPIVKEISASDIFPVLYIMVSGDVGLRRLKDIAEDLEEDIEGIKGVLDVQVLGALEREIRVEFDQDRIAAYGLTVSEIVLTVTQNNVNTPGGSIDIGEGKYSLKVPGEFVSPEEVDRLVVAVRGGNPIYLSDIAVVRDTFKDRDSFSRINGKEAVAVRVTKRQGENLLRIAERIKQIVAVYREKLPEQVTLTITSDTSKYIERMVWDLENNILSGLILVLVVIFLSLGFRNALLVSLAIPISMLISFLTLQALGITLNMVVLFSLILALGMLVDNSIVIVENIYRHHTSEGKPLVDAAIEGVGEVAWPVVSSTLTTVVAFSPLLFWPGIMGQFMGYLPKTVIIALLASLFVAMIITPPLCVVIMRSRRPTSPVRKKKTHEYGPIIRAYRAFLMLGLRYRVISILFFFGLLVLSIQSFGVSGLGAEMFPDTEPSRIMVDITAPEGTNVYRTDQFARQAEAIIGKYGNIEFLTTAVGAGSGNESGSNTARIMIDLVDREFRRDAGTDGKIHFRNSNDAMAAIRADLLDSIVGAEVKVEKEKNGPPVGAPINVEIAGDDYATLSRLSDTLKSRIRDIPGIVDLTDDYVAGLPEIQVVVDKERAALLGLSTFMIGQLVKASVNGIKIASYREGQDEFDITARLPEVQRSNLQDILRLRVPDIQGTPVPLTSVARIERTSGLSSIKHIDQKRVVSVSANVAQGYNAQQLLAEVRRQAAGISLPPGYAVRYTGENEEFEESKAFMMQAFLTACLLILLVLVTQFNSFLQPVMIMVSVLLSLIGVFLGLLLTHTAFGVIMTGMGVVSLAGVVVNNAIVLIDYTNQLRQRGLSCYDAVVRAGCTRFRPVMLTAITTILGLIPMAIGVSYNFRQKAWEIGGESAQWWGPMAIAVIFGLAVATMLTLFVLPNLYSLFYDWGLYRRQRGEAGQKAHPPETAAPPATPEPA